MHALLARVGKIISLPKNYNAARPQKWYIDIVEQWFCRSCVQIPVYYYRLFLLLYSEKNHQILALLIYEEQQILNLNFKWGQKQEKTS